MIEVTSHVEPSAEDPNKPVLTEQIKWVHLLLDSRARCAKVLMRLDVSASIRENPPRGKLWSNLSPESRRPEIKGTEGSNDQEARGR